MAIYRIYLDKDASIYSEPNTANQYFNTGKDEVLDIGIYLDSNLNTRIMRSLIHFPIIDIQKFIQEEGISQYTASLHLHNATATNIPAGCVIQACTISGSWEEGAGKYGDTPVDSSGVSWISKQAYGESEWAEPGGDILSIVASQSLEPGYCDLSLNITSALGSILSHSIENNGILLKLSEETTSGSFSALQYFSADTHTIYAPYLQIAWNDNIRTGSLQELSSDIFSVSLKGLPKEIQGQDGTKVRLSVKPKYPNRMFSTSSLYTQSWTLPSGSCWAIRDAKTQEIIIPFDKENTQISVDETGNYFTLYPTSLYPARYYSVLVKAELDNSTYIVESAPQLKVKE